MKPFPVTRLYTGTDIHSYFEDMQIELSSSTLICHLSEELDTKMVQSIEGLGLFGVKSSTNTFSCDSLSTSTSKGQLSSKFWGSG